jgi:peptidoglycan/LPS O-acetylase OafA/YrhL
MQIFRRAGSTRAGRADADGPVAPQARDARLPGLDAAKGVAIVLVVLIHAAPPAPDWWVYGMVNGVARLAVPVFIAITGFLMGARNASRDKVRSYFFTFLRLHLLYGAFYWAVAAVFTGRTGAGSLHEMLLHFYAYSYPGQFYFFILLQLFFLLSWIPPRVCAARPALVAGLATTLLAVAFLRWSAEQPPTAGPLWLAERLGEAGFWVWLHFLVLGVFLGAHPKVLPRLPAAFALVALGVLLAAFDVPGMDPGHAERRPYARLSIVAGATPVILALPALARLRAPRWIQALGRESFGVFVLNPFVLRVLAIALGPRDGLALSLAHAALATALAFALARLGRRFVPMAVP